MHINRIVPLAAGVLVALSGAAQAAGTATTSFGVSASVAANCIVTAVPMPFGAYDGTAAKTTSQDLKVRCTKNLPYTVKLSGGAANSFAPRKLNDGGSNTLEYNLFSDGGRTSVWGDGVGASAVPGVGNGMGVASAVTHTIFAELFNSLANQAAPVGNYADTIAVEVAY
jgi:spore coat protein U-like protein